MKRRWYLGIIGASLLALFLALWVAAPAHAAVQIFKPPTAQAAASISSLPVGISPVTVNKSELNALPLFTSVELVLPGKPSYSVIYDRYEQHRSGNQTWIGYLQDYGTNYRVVLTTGPAGTWGRILTPDGEFLVGTVSGQEYLADAKAANLRPAIPSEDDGAVPSAKALEAAASPRGATALAAPTPQSTVDVLVVFTPSLVTQLGSLANVQLRIDQQIATSNQAYIDSDIAITLRLVHAEQVAYSDATDMPTALYDITGNNGSGPWPIPATLSGVPGLRNTYGADLVVLMRAFNTVTQGGTCGIGWIGGYGGAGSLTGWDAYGYSVVSNGIDINWPGFGSYYYCDDLTFVHELGHNMGDMHDHRTCNGCPAGVFNYSFGYGVDNSFATVMAYPSSYTNAGRIGKFSNPLVSCNGFLCGVSSTGGAPSNTWADNALSMNNIRSDVAAYRTTAVSQAPSATTGAASNVTAASATLNGTVNPNGSATNAWFEWGTTVPYDYSTSVQAVGSGSSNAAVSAGISGLSNGVTYHYRAVASSSAGTTYGADATFVASNAPALNVALAANGGAASASSTHSSGLYPLASVNNNERKGANWGSGSTANGGWNDNTSGAYPDWVQIQFSGSKTINKVVVYTVQDNYSNPAEPTDALTFTQYGIRNFTVDAWDGSAWVTLATIANNNLVKRTFSFADYTTDRIRVNITNALAGFSRITEIEAWGN